MRIIFIHQKVKDKYTNLFQQIQILYPSELWDVIDTVQLDKLYLLQHGQRILSPMAIDKSVEQIAQILGSLFVPKWLMIMNWNDYVKTLHQNYKEKFSETIEDTDQSTGTTTDINQVSAYDSETMVDDTKQTSDNMQDSTHSRTRVYKLERLLKPDEIFGLTNFLYDEFIPNNIFKDVNAMLTLSIYE